MEEWSLNPTVPSLPYLRSKTKGKTIIFRYSPKLNWESDKLDKKKLTTYLFNLPETFSLSSGSEKEFWLGFNDSEIDRFKVALLITPYLPNVNVE